MILSMSGQAFIFLTTVVIGAFAGFVFDCFRVLRRTVRHANIAIQLEDLLFWLFVPAMLFYTLLNINYGEIRFYSIAGVIIGMVLYFNTLSRLFLPLSVTIVNFIKKTVAAAINILLTPFRFILRLLSFPLGILKKTIKNAQNRTYVGLCKSKKYAKMKLRKLAAIPGVKIRARPKKK